MTTQQHIDRLNEEQAPFGKLLALVDLVTEEVRAALSGVPTERQVEKAKLELSSAVWAMVGPLLSSPMNRSWPDVLAIAQRNAQPVLRWFNEVPAPIGKRVAEDGRRAVALAQLRGNHDPVERAAEELQQRMAATIEAVNRHIRLRHPRLPPDSAAQPLFDRAFATLMAVIVASATVSHGNRFSDANVNACRDECLRSLQEWAKLFGVKHLPALDSDLAHEKRQRAEAEQFRARLDAQSAEDDEFGLSGD